MPTVNTHGYLHAEKGTRTRVVLRRRRNPEYAKIQSVIIRPEQLRALSLAQQQNFEERACEYLCKSHPDNPAIRDPTVLRTSVRDGIEQAIAYKITGETDVIRFLEFCVTLGGDFHRSEEYAKILFREASAEERLDEILERVRFGDLTRA